ncbi:MAG TPA: hypothetical protein ENK18_21400, partial [Deltaproteobacteria bacterium]|nr:hypothetical protein [Deltaproteobacteria bacterium]
YSGTDTLSFVGAVPFLGVSSDLMVPGLGVGLALAVPTGRGGKLQDFDGPNRYALREGNIQTIHTMVAASYRLKEKVSLGMSGSLVNSRYYADTDTTIYPDLAQGVADILVLDEQPASYQDGYVEHPGYTAGSIFELKDTTFTFGAGVYLTPIGDRLGLSLAYNHGMRLDHTGDLTLDFRCPPAFDPQSRAAAEEIGTCNRTATGSGSIGYRLPSRLHLGVVLQPIQRLRLELMGGYVFWSVFTDYEVSTSVSNAAFPGASNALAAQEAALLASQERLWARDHHDTFWVGLDGKAEVVGPLSLGARLIYDQGAVDEQSVSANNYDADTVLLGGLIDVTPAGPISFSLSFSHQFLADRIVTDSPFGVGVDPSAFDGRYFYPSANGTYSGSINRIGLAVRGRFLGGGGL